MRLYGMYTTPVSLLQRLREPNAEEAWNRFVALYTPLLVHWTRRLGLSDAEAADVVQEVFVILLRELPKFSYRPGSRFRGWLWTVTLNKHRERQRLCKQPLAWEAAGEVASPEPDPGDEVAEAEYRSYLVERAMQLMRTDFEPTTWQACWRYVAEGRPAAEVAAELGISVNAVHLAKARVLRRLRRELDGLLD
jgi:RNA polymerase sigma-70 factor (ECF subfamily)